MGASVPGTGTGASGVGVGVGAVSVGMGAGTDVGGRTRELVGGTGTGAAGFGAGTTPVVVLWVGFLRLAAVTQEPLGLTTYGFLHTAHRCALLHFTQCAWPVLHLQPSMSTLWSTVCKLYTTITVKAEQCPRTRAE